MESFLGRYRNLIVLVGVLFAQVLGLAVQVKRSNDLESTRLIRLWAVDAVSPPEKTLAWVQGTVSGVWHNYFYLRGVRAENRALRQEIERMRLEEVRVSQDADQARRLQVLLAFKEQFISQTVAAQVIGSSGSEQSRAVYIDKGEDAGIKPDMAVITADGVVGKVLHVYGSTSQVLLINDQTSGVGAILEKSRLQGILRGTPAGEIALEKVMSDETVPVGELVLTSGGDRIFPKGLPVGRVTKVSPGADLFLNIRVKPAISLSRLEEVLVVTKIDERQAEPDRSGTARAADILAERLPSVPPKPENAPGGAAAPSPSGSAAKPAADSKPKGSPPASATNGTASVARKAVTAAPLSAGSAAKPTADATPKVSSPASASNGTAPVARKAVTLPPPSLDSAAKRAAEAKPKVSSPASATTGTAPVARKAVTAAPLSAGSAAKPTADATPKVSSPASATIGAAPVARKAVISAPASAGNVPKTAAGSGVKTTPKAAKPAAQPQPQPAAQDPPQ